MNCCKNFIGSLKQLSKNLQLPTMNMWKGNEKLKAIKVYTLPASTQANFHTN